MTKTEVVLLSVFTAGVLGVMAITIMAAIWGLIPTLLAAFCLIVCIIALWSISFYIGTRA